MTLEVEQQLGMEIRKLTTQIQVRRVGTLTKANFGVGGGEGRRENISVTWNLLGVSVKFTFLALVIFCYYGKFQIYKSREKSINGPLPWKL